MKHLNCAMPKSSKDGEHFAFLKHASWTITQSPLKPSEHFEDHDLCEHVEDLDLFFMPGFHVQV